MKVCDVCGRRFACRPEFWPYRRGDYYFCREDCMIVFDTRVFRERIGWIEDHYRRKEKMKKVTLEQKNKAVEIAIGGGDPLKFLAECGSGNPSACWYQIRKMLKEKDPAKYELLPKREDAKKEEPKVDITINAEELLKTDVDVPKIVTCCAPSTREGVEVPDEFPVELPVANSKIGRSAEILENQEKSVKKERKSMKKARKPVNYDGYEVSAVRSEALGEFYFDRKFNSLDWRTVEGEEIGMSPVGWHQLMNELPKIMGILGI